MKLYFPDSLLFANAGMRGDSRLFRLSHRFRYISSYGVISVPQGFITDGASIPKIFWSIFDPFGPYFEAAIIHDYLYSKNNNQFNRFQSDEIFREAMYNIGIDWVRREAIYRAVRIFGGKLFDGIVQ